MASNAQREGFLPDTPDNEPPKTMTTDDGRVLDIVTGAPVEPEPQKEVWPVKVRLLHKPIRDNRGNEVKEISFREPTGGDINRYGNPVRVNQDGDIVIDERKMSWVMSALSGILTPMLEQMDPRDWNSCAYRLRGFFLPDPSAW